MTDFQTQSKVVAKALVANKANAVFHTRAEPMVVQPGVMKYTWVQTDTPDYYSMVGVTGTTVPVTYGLTEEAEEAGTPIELPANVANPEVWCFYPDYALAMAAQKVKHLPISVAISKLIEIAKDKNIGVCTGQGHYGYYLYMSEVADLLEVSMFNKHFRDAFCNVAEKESQQSYRPDMAYDCWVLV